MSNRFGEFSTADLQEINRRTIARLQGVAEADEPAPAAPVPEAVVPAAVSKPGLFANIVELLDQMRAAKTQSVTISASAPGLEALASFSRDDLRDAFIQASRKVK